MRQLSLEEVKESSLKSIGLPSSQFNLNSTEALANLIRRAAAFLCPCTSKTLIDSVFQSINGLNSDIELTATLENVLEGLLGYGDLFELDDLNSETRLRRPLLYTAPPSFVKRGNGALFMIGVAVDRSLTVSEEIKDNIIYRGVTRQILNTIPEELIEFGFIEISQDVWLKTPPKESANGYLNRLDKILDNSSNAGDIPGLFILDANKQAHFYAGRWVEVKSQTGRYVGRRPQAYGNNLWCYIELKEGRAQRLIDFPINVGRDRGCDEGWRLQTAIDKACSNPQKFRVQKMEENRSSIDFFSPIPKWARRRLDITGIFQKTSGNLFSYSFNNNEIQNEIDFLVDMMWLEKI